MRLRPMIGWAVFFFIVVIVVQALPSSPRATFYFFKGKQRMAARDFEGAVVAFKESVESDPGFARGFVDLGSCYLALEQYSESEQALKQAMSVRPDSCAACGLGMVYRAQGRRKDAETYFNKSIALNTKDWCAYNQLGQMYYEAKEYPEAVAAFKQEVALRRNAVSFHALANSLHHSGKIRESLEYYVASTRVNPNYEDVLVDMGSDYHDLGMTPYAVEAFERAIKLEPNDLKAHAFLGVAQYEMGNRHGAMKQYQLLLEKNPELATELMRGFEKLSPDVKRVELLTARPK